jgi:hypothetical protein
VELIEAMPDLAEHDDALAAVFADFFPDVVANRPTDGGA